MNIRKAIKKAQIHGSGIARRSWSPQWGWLLPTNSEFGILLMPYEFDGEISPRWEPSLDDLLADDWEAFSVIHQE